VGQPTWVRLRVNAERGKSTAPTITLPDHSAVHNVKCGRPQGGWSNADTCGQGEGVENWCFVDVLYGRLLSCVRRRHLRQRIGWTEAGILEEVGGAYFPLYTKGKLYCSVTSVHEALIDGCYLKSAQQDWNCNRLSYWQSTITNGLHCHA